MNSFDCHNVTAAIVTPDHIGVIVSQKKCHPYIILLSFTFFYWSAVEENHKEVTNVPIEITGQLKTTTSETLALSLIYLCLST